MNNIDLLLLIIASAVYFNFGWYLGLNKGRKERDNK